MARAMARRAKKTRDRTQGGRGRQTGRKLDCPPSTAAGNGRRGESVLLTQAEFLDRGEVGVAIRPLEVAEEPVATADHRKEATTRRVVVSMIGEVRLQGLDAVGENRDLDLGRT